MLKFGQFITENLSSLMRYFPREVAQYVAKQGSSHDGEVRMYTDPADIFDQITDNPEIEIAGILPIVAQNRKEEWIVFLANAIDMEDNLHEADTAVFLKATFTNGKVKETKLKAYSFLNDFPMKRYWVVVPSARSIRKFDAKINSSFTPSGRNTAYDGMLLKSKAEEINKISKVIDIRVNANFDNLNLTINGFDDLKKRYGIGNNIWINNSTTTFEKTKNYVNFLNELKKHLEKQQKK